jgi:hypothetical protein
MRLPVVTAFVASTLTVGCSAGPQPVTVTQVSSATAAPTYSLPPPTPPPGYIPPSPRPHARVYSGNGAYSVGQEPTGGLLAAMLPGRYRLQVAPGYENGLWARCNDELCGPGNVDDVIKSGYALGPSSTQLIEVLPTDASVWLFQVTLTSVDLQP